MTKKKPNAFEDIRLVGIHKEPTFGPGGLAVELRLPAASKCIEEQFERIKQLEAELDKHRWIPVEERLPKDKGFYLVARKPQSEIKAWWRNKT